MQTIVGISLSPVYILPLMFIFSIIGRTLLFRVRYFLSDTEHLWYKTHTAVLSGIWLYSIAVALIILSSSPLIYRIHAVLILSFMLQMAVTDALTGLLPGTFTRRFLIAGILSQITTDIWWLRATEIVSAAIVLFCLHKLVNRHRLNIGTGDLWLIAGITAWSGLYNAIWSVLLGAGGFVLWHSTWC
ncbi:prepilin peptidase, partial [Salmonella enterica]|nr:prepilin peptidase [Escherichia coli]